MTLRLETFDLTTCDCHTHRLHSHPKPDTGRRMAQTFVFEELDEPTRDYLMAVRDAEGESAPGVFAPTSSALAGCGCIAGPIIIIATLLFTLTDWIDVIYDDPVRVAL